MSFEDPFRKDDDAATAAANLPAAESLEDQISSLTARLDEVETERRELQDRLLRAAAELENYKKRVRREQTEAARFAAEPLVRDLLPALDNLERALAHTGAGEGASLVEGVTMVLKSLRDVLKQHGVTVLEARVGDPFDPNVHEAVDRRVTEGEPNRVVELWQPGYQMHERLIRPARVVVSTPRVAN